jgi:outer membrane protein
VIDKRSALETKRLNLLQLINARSASGGKLWDRPVNLENQPFVPQGVLDPVDAHVQVALRMRSDLNQARLQVQRGDLELVKTRNGLLPQLDLFITLGKTGYASVFNRSVDDLFTRPSYDALAGVRFEFPVGNRSARASNTRAVLARDQSAEAVNNLILLVEVDVRGAYIEVTRTREQIAATAATRRLQEQKYRTEVEKLGQGKSTSLLVAQTERDLLAARIAEIQAVVANLKATVTLFRLEGSLLERRGISAPANEPVG